MEIKEFRNKKKILEKNIQDSVQKLIDDFKKETDLFPIDISINILNHTTGFKRK